MAHHNNLGKSGEYIAKEYLASKGYAIRDVNWRSGKYELDIVAMDGLQLVVVEVKTRSTDEYGYPE
ncbi:MAG: YraN family protein, partial [Bacteroidales bacterium]